ncbi:DNA-binding domain-containing protein [Shewanella salipaludis]|uniref:DUF2063 domain-containing protein n=1 Tax=Shewanella salipaludis TaxID=2723052 RepID=A0A972FVD3_9GAMM|nr:DNA-binding domain-containing protein [Shewanella salipaludis]NMH65974.1 DUF2063 domain-containing protein [Shewanella salipaludis]
MSKDQQQADKGRLHQLQQDFMAYLLQGEPGPALADRLKRQIRDQGGISLDTRIGIYANAYRVRLTEVLETDHPNLALYLGDDLWNTLTSAFIQARPSQFRSLRDFGDALPDFLRQHPQFNQDPILADIAAFERRLLNAFDAPEQPRAAFEQLQGLAPALWPGCRLRFHPSVQLFKCHSNAVESWQALKQGQAPAAADYSAQRAWLLWRGESRLTEFISLAPYQLALLEGFLAGEDFATQCAAMLAYVDADQAPVTVLQSLQAWFSMGLIARLDPGRQG